MEEKSQQWRAVGNTVSDLTGPRFEPYTSRSRDKHVTAQPTGRLHKISYMKIGNQTTKVIAKAMKIEAEKEMESREKPSNIIKFVKFMKRDGKDFEGGIWIKGKDQRIGYSHEH